VNSSTSAPPWQPLTFGGVAAFAGGPFRRLLQVQAVVAVGASLTLVWFLLAAWTPALNEALAQLPESAAIRQGQLQWNDNVGRVLGQTPFLSIAVNPRGSAPPGTTADVQVLLMPDGVRLTSLLGHWNLPYWPAYSMDLSNREMTATWEAWRRMVVAGIFAAGIGVLTLYWWGLALLAGAPVRALAALLRRELTTAGSWRLAVAAMFPGTLLCCAAIIMYGLFRLSLVGLLLALALHWVAIVVYLFFAPWHLPKLNRTRTATNPFNPQTDGPPRSRTPNPFASED